MKNNKVLQNKAYNLKLNRNDTILFHFLAAEQGLTPEQLIENFVCDIVSSFHSEEITAEEKNLADWFNGSWFSQDNDGYFSFLQYLIRNKLYARVIVSNDKAKIRYLFEKYCTQNPAHKAFTEEIKIINDFNNNLWNITKGRIKKWH